MKPSLTHFLAVPPGLLSLFVVLVLIVQSSAEAATNHAEDAARFMSEVSTHFAAWDTDHNGILSAAELDARVVDPGISGDQAVAVATLKRASRSMKFE